MAGVNIEITGLDAVQSKFKAMVDKGEDLSGVFGEIGERLLESTTQRFKQEEAPDGTPWAPLKKSTINRKLLKGVRKGNNGKRSSTIKSGRWKPQVFRNFGNLRILHESGNLQDTIAYQSDKQSVEVGSNRIYAATHQFGADDRKIPARPFLGLSEDDNQMIVELILQELDKTE